MHGNHKLILQKHLLKPAPMQCLQGSCCEIQPAEVITRVLLPAGTETRKFPVLSVCAPMLVPFTVTEAPATGTLLLSVTVPLTVLCCAQPATDSRRQAIA